ncbi:MAG TPA: sortase [Candidatus Limnocylindrales bacterium]
MVPTASRPNRSRTVATLALLVVTALVPAVAPGRAVARQPVVLSAPDRAPGALGAPPPRGPSPIERAHAADIRDASATSSATGSTATRPSTAWIERPTLAVPEPTRGTERRDTGTSSYRGRDHVWIPALGIDRSVAFFSCSRSSYPGDRVYRWGCAGSNNVYLFGHAHSVFKPLHDAYVRGRLRKGMRVFYADGAGRVREYTVRWWKVTKPDRGEFAYAAQSRPSLTLQTCVGAKSQYRLIVRLVRVG